MDYGIYTRLAVEMSKAQRIIFTRPDETQITVNNAHDPTTVEAYDSNNNQLPYDTDRYKDILFDKDVLENRSLIDIVGKTKINMTEHRIEQIPISDLRYTIPYEDDDVRAYHIYDGNELVLDATMFKRKQERKMISNKDFFNEAILYISKEYTFEHPKGSGRVIMGIDTTNIICNVKKPIKRIRQVRYDPAPNITEYITVGFLVRSRDEPIGFAYIDCNSGKCLRFIGELPDRELIEESKNVLHKYREKYLETLKQTENEINKRIV